MISVVHPTGNRNSLHAALSAKESNLLHLFVTGLRVETDRGWARWMPMRLKRELEKRSFSELGDDALALAPLREMIRLGAQRMRLGSLITGEFAPFGVDRLYQVLDKKVSRWISSLSGSHHIHLYEDGAAESLKMCNAMGLTCTYELPIGYWRTHQRICEEERELNPLWCEGWNAHQFSKSKGERKDEELSNSQHVVVPSDFVANSLQDFPGKLGKISQVPYGCPPVWHGQRKPSKKGKLKVLYVGGLSQRKGISYLCDALSGLGSKIEVTFVGIGPLLERIRLAIPEARFTGAISHAEVLSEMRSHDVMVFPSLFEGMALVVAEALSQGTPVITTPNSGTVNLGIEKNQAGWVVPIRKSEPIREILLELLEDLDLRVATQEGARKLAASHQWGDYRKRIMDVWSSFGQ